MSKMQQQYEDNLECQGEYILWKNLCDRGFQFRFRHLGNCEALIFESDTHIWLLSYRTVVAIINKANPYTGYDVLRYTYGYTATSAQHIAKFFKIQGVTNVIRWRRIPDTFCPD